MIILWYNMTRFVTGSRILLSTSLRYLMCLFDVESGAARVFTYRIERNLNRLIYWRKQRGTEDDDYEEEIGLLFKGERSQSRFR